MGGLNSKHLMSAKGPLVLEKTLESPLACKEIQPVHSEGDQPWDFFGGNDAEAGILKARTLEWVAISLSNA